MEKLQGRASETYLDSQLKNYDLIETPQTDNERHTSPVWYNGLVYFLSERDYANNVWSFDPQSKELIQRTFHSDFDVKNLGTEFTGVITSKEEDCIF